MLVMNYALDLTGALIYFVLNIVLFPIFILVHLVLLFWSFEKFAALQVKKFKMRFKNRPFEYEQRGTLAFIRKTFHVSH
jgi:hypothetical protein